MPYQGTFDATQFTPRQAGDAHPAGKFPATISNTSIVPTKDNSGGMFVVEFTTPAGIMFNRYNLWNASTKAVEIANNELSALCYATGVFKLDFQNDGAALCNARCIIDVGPQMKDGHPTNYMEIKKVFDANGNEPGKAVQPSQGQQLMQQPQQQQPQPQTGGWGAPTQPPQQQQNAPMQQSPGGGWGTAQTNAPSNPPAAGNTPPWGQR